MRPTLPCGLSQRTLLHKMESRNPPRSVAVIHGHLQTTRDKGGKKEETEDARSHGNQLDLSEVCTECVFEALSWDVDWTAPASSNYGINAGAMKQQIEELAKVLTSSQAGAVIEMWDCLTILPTRPLDPGAWRSMRRATCCDADSNEISSVFGKDVFLKPMSLPLAFELAMLSVLALVRTAPLNIEAQPSREETLTRIESGLPEPMRQIFACCAMVWKQWRWRSGATLRRHSVRC